MVLWRRCKRVVRYDVTNIWGRGKFKKSKIRWGDNMLCPDLIYLGFLKYIIKWEVKGTKIIIFSIVINLRLPIKNHRLLSSFS